MYRATVVYITGFYTAVLIGKGWLTILSCKVICKSFPNQRLSTYVLSPPALPSSNQFQNISKENVFLTSAWCCKNFCRKKA